MTAPRLILLIPLLSCAGAPPSGDGPAAEGALPPCPDSPNCVSSDAADEEHHVAPFRLAVDAGEAWRATRAAVAELPRTRIVTENETRLHAECRSRLFRFVDDLQLELRAGDGLVAVRSASRVGYSDMGVNRRRVESLREALAERGVLR